MLKTLMKIICPNEKYTFELGNEEAEIILSWQSPADRNHYLCGSYDFLIELTEIETPVRGNKALWFRNVEAVSEIINGFRNDSALPPIEVTNRDLSGTKEFRLKDGFHRYWLCHMVGFTKIPAKLNNYLISDSD